MPPKTKVAVPGPKSSADPDRVWLNVERKYRVAQYESMTISLGASTTVEAGETPRAALRRTFDELRAEFADVVEVMREQEGV